MNWKIKPEKCDNHCNLGNFLNNNNNNNNSKKKKKKKLYLLKKIFFFCSIILDRCESFTKKNFVHQFFFVGRGQKFENYYCC